MGAGCLCLACSFQLVLLPEGLQQPLQACSFSHSCLVSSLFFVEKNVLPGCCLQEDSYVQQMVFLPCPHSIPPPCRISPVDAYHSSAGKVNAVCYHERMAKELGACILLSLTISKILNTTSEGGWHKPGWVTAHGCTNKCTQSIGLICMLSRKHLPAGIRPSSNSLQ